MKKFESLLEQNDSEDGSIDGENDSDSEAHDYSDVFYSWECVSFLKKSGSTLDLTISSVPDLMALIHVVHHHIYHEKIQLTDQT